MSAASAEVPNVLIVEDEMMLGVDIVEDAGFRPIEAVNAEAMSILKSRSDISLLLPIFRCPAAWTA